jgi:NAD(P)-dependent dehydrogenase (short-subunit alcohol dehydrogenase family)
MSSSGSVVLITGASRGIGLETARFLAEQGCTVYAGTRENPPPPADASLKFKGRVIPITLDVNHDESVKTAVKAIFERENRLDVLVNNAGYAIMGPLESCSIQEHQDLFNTLVFGPIRLFQAVLPWMEEHQTGKIINIGSQSGITPSPSHESYSAAKAALASYSISMAARLAFYNIRVSLIDAGPIKTEIANRAPLGSEHINFATSDFQQKSSAIMKQALENGDDPQKIAHLVWEIIQTDLPQARYQIGSPAISTAKDLLKDPSGKYDVDRITDLFIKKGLFPKPEESKMKG